MFDAVSNISGFNISMHRNYDNDDDKQITGRVQFQIWHLQIGAPDQNSFRQEELLSISTCPQSMKIDHKFGPRVKGVEFSSALVAPYMSPTSSCTCH